MRCLFLFLVLSISTVSIFGQNITGKVYDSESTVKGIRVINSSQNIVTITDNKGNFSIAAKVNDTLLFQSIFHLPQKETVTQSHFKGIYVFELKKKINELDEVLLTKEPDQPVFTETEYNNNLKQVIQNDIKNNPHLYSPSGGLKGPDLIAIIGKIAKLFKKKKPTPIPPITYEQLKILFNTNELISISFLEKQLEIPKEYIPLFIEYCSARELSSDLLKKENEIYLLDAIIINSTEYLKILEEFKASEIIKD